eukprot:gene5125-34931_t
MKFRLLAASETAELQTPLAFNTLPGSPAFANDEYPISCDEGAPTLEEMIPPPVSDPPPPSMEEMLPPPTSETPLLLVEEMMPPPVSDPTPPLMEEMMPPPTEGGDNSTTCTVTTSSQANTTSTVKVQESTSDQCDAPPSAGYQQQYLRQAQGSRLNWVRLNWVRLNWVRLKAQQKGSRLLLSVSHILESFTSDS